MKIKESAARLAPATGPAALSLQAGYTLCGLGVLLDLGMAPGFRCDGHAARSVLQYG